MAQTNDLEAFAFAGVLHRQNVSSIGEEHQHRQTNMRKFVYLYYLDS